MSRWQILFEDAGKIAQGVALVASEAARHERRAASRAAAVFMASNFPHTKSPHRSPFDKEAPISFTNHPFQDQPPSPKATNPQKSSDSHATHLRTSQVPEPVQDQVPIPGRSANGRPTITVSPPESSSSSQSEPAEDARSRGSAWTASYQHGQRTERAVPSTQLGRVVGFGGVAARLVFGTLSDKVTSALGFVDTPGKQSPKSPSQRAAGGAAAAGPSADNPSGSPPSTNPDSSRTKPQIGPKGSLLSVANAERLAAGLCRMRGAALKVGQMLSIQDSSIVPPELQEILERVRHGADVMPRQQLEKVLSTELGDQWQQQFADFDWSPIAAASIGQVHRGRLQNGREVALKVQYPGVAESIDSDINNLKRMMRWLSIMPDGMYLDNTLESAKEELALECNYLWEADCQERFRELLKGHPLFRVPAVVRELSTRRILTTDLVAGSTIDKLPALNIDQATRNEIASEILLLTLRELFEWRFMQTDPNWSNFLYNSEERAVYLLDFGASREYGKPFVDSYLKMVHACAARDRESVIQHSIDMGFLTGEESKSMLDAHVAAGFIIGEPFGSREPYDFVQGNISERVSKHVSAMLKQRLTPPPKEVYTLHRKLSGAFLTCTKLRAQVDARPLFEGIYAQYGSTSKST